MPLALGPAIHSMRRLWRSITLALFSMSICMISHAQTMTYSQALVALNPAILATTKQADEFCGLKMLMAVSINGRSELADEQIVRLRNGQLAANSAALKHWRVGAPTETHVLCENEIYYPLDNISGLSYTIDKATLTLQLKISNTAFLTSRFSGDNKLQPNLKVSPGGFFNYDLLTQRSNNNQLSNGLFEAGMFNQNGVATGTFLWQDQGTPQRLTRLETAWTHDDPESISRFQLGDGISRAGTWGRSIRYAGLQWRTNFETQPGYVTFPQPSTSGIAALPSTVDVYINNMRQLSQEVQAGPFEINNLPVITGSGEVKLVVNDLLGRQQVITQPYYASQSLLRAGLSDYSYEAGFTRQDYSRLSNHYGQLFGVATQRYGVNEHFTRELRAEVQTKQQTVGLSGAYLWPALGTVQGAVATSHNDSGNGVLFMAGMEHVDRQYSWSMQTQVSSPLFNQLSWVAGNVRPKSLSSLRLGLPLGEYGGSLSLNYINQQYWGQSGNSIYALNYGRILFKEFYLMLYAARSITEASNANNNNNSIGININHYFGEGISANTQFTRQNASNDGTLQVSKNLPDGPGFGYNLMAKEGVNSRQEANVLWQTSTGTYMAGCSQQTGDTALRIGASGGVAFLGGSAFASRRITDSFAVVNVGGYPDVQVYYENRPVGITNNQGLVLITRLRPYQENQISIAPEDLPFEAQIDAVKLILTPALRSGIYSEFAITTARGGTLAITQEDGSFIPTGATVKLHNQTEVLPVGLRGQVYLAVLDDTNDLLVTWKQQTCRINIQRPSNASPIADLGSKVCKWDNQQQVFAKQAYNYALKLSTEIRP